MKTFQLCAALLCVCGLTILAAGQEKPEPTPEAVSQPAPTPEKPAPTATGSLFRDNAPGLNLVTDYKARQVGDLLFVTVTETSTATVTSTAKRSRNSGTLGGLTTLLAALPIPGAATAGTVAGALGQRTYEGKGTTDRTSNVRARIAARVVEVLPNGDLRIEAARQVKINKETEKLALTGIVRPRDISADNSVTSPFVGDLQFVLNGKGIASQDNAPGWLFRLFERLTPF